jgi:hypothetical protein
MLPVSILRVAAIKRIARITRANTPAVRRRTIPVRNIGTEIVDLIEANESDLNIRKPADSHPPASCFLFCFPAKIRVNFTMRHFFTAR